VTPATLTSAARGVAHARSAGLDRFARIARIARTAWLARAAAAVLMVGLLAAAPAARAGRSCEPRPPTVDQVRQGLVLAQATARALEAGAAQVVVLGRAGQDLSAYGLQWSHLAFAYRLPPAGDQPARWRVVHKLNHCGSAEAALYRQGLAEFFLDDPHRYDAIIAPLDRALEAKLLALLQDDRLLAVLHESAYNMLAYPWAVRYQQSNQWLIETLAVAAEPGVTSRRQAQAWLQLKAYEPTVLKLGALTRLGARISRANVAFDDHPTDERFSDRIATVTADSVLDWLPRAGLGGPALRVR